MSRTFEEWSSEITAAISEPSPALGNLRITLAHADLARALEAAVGLDAGANFHSWAVWGSKKAGETIRGEDTVRVARHMRGASLVAGVAAAALSMAAGMALVAVVLAAFITGGGVWWWFSRALARAKLAVLEGNRTVLDDIGRVTARFVTLPLTAGVRPGDCYDEFCRSLKPGRTEAGGQALLRRAFEYYEEARQKPDLDGKHEAMLMANCYAILHEHVRLQPYILRAMPSRLARLITDRSLRFHLGKEAHRVRADVPTLLGHPFPETLRTLETPELIAFLRGMDGWDRTPDSLDGSRARDWSSIEDRMNFIVDLFRSRHLSPDVVAPPFDDVQCQAIRAGRMPHGSL